MNSSLQLVVLAMANGGDERNIDPGFDAMVKLAKTGNIGRVYTVLSEAISSMTSGETSVIYTDSGTLAPMGRTLNLNYLTKTDPSLRTALVTEGWVILKSTKNRKAACDFVNYSISPKENEEWNKAISCYPTNRKAAAADGMEFMAFSEEERSKYVYFPDFDYISTQLDTWTKRFEQDVAPLLR
jgi:putative spermidine/putrescine transport system substrate-binding protein